MTIHTPTIRLVRQAVSLAALLAGCGAALADSIPAGRYRCYQPPSYTVITWFDLLPDGTYRFQGEAPARYRYDPATRSLLWDEGAFASSHAGASYHPPAAASPSQQRHTIVLEAREAHAGDAAVECYLTTH